MANSSFYEKPKRFDKLTKTDHEDLAFDLINAFAIVKNPTDSALLLHDLLTRIEIKNLAKRLRIAKLLLSGKTHDEIIEELHCSYATTSKVRAWLEEGGEGLKKVITNLPKRIGKPKPPRTYPSPNFPLILLAAVQELGQTKQKRRVEKFLDSLEKKHLIDKQIRKRVSEEFKILYQSKRKGNFRKSTSLHRGVGKVK